MAKYSFALALLGLLALTLVTDVVSVAVSDPIPREFQPALPVQPPLLPPLLLLSAA